MLDYQKMALAMKNEVAGWRHQFHSHPELSYQEENTTKRIVEILREIGYENIRVGVPHCPNSGVTVDLNPGKPGRCIALRADIDALPVTEETGLEYASQEPGVMHACGHDSHISMLLGAAKLLYQIRDQVPGNVRFIFQPGEESTEPLFQKWGAQLVTEGSGWMDGVDAAFALHAWGTLPTGVIHYTPGPFMTANMVARMKVCGVGGHGAMPHTCVDPVVIACQIVTAWQTIVSRETDPLNVAVVTVTDIEAESTGAFNVIPPSVSLVVGVRTYNEELMDTVARRMEEIARGIATGMRAEIEFSAEKGVPPVVNDPTFTERAAKAIRKAVGKDHITKTSPVAPSEDFAWYLKKVPGALMFLGVGDAEKGTNYAQHHPKFNVDDDAMPVGIASLAAVACDYLAGSDEPEGE